MRSFSLSKTIAQMLRTGRRKVFVMSVSISMGQPFSGTTSRHDIPAHQKITVKQWDALEHHCQSYKFTTTQNIHVSLSSARSQPKDSIHRADALLTQVSPVFDVFHLHMQTESFSRPCFAGLDSMFLSKETPFD